MSLELEDNLTGRAALKEVIPEAEVCYLLAADKGVLSAA